MTPGTAENLHFFAAQEQLGEEVAVEFIRNHTLINWMQSLSTEEMRKDYVEGYFRTFAAISAHLLHYQLLASCF